MIGQSLPRFEDAALLTGRGRFIDDVDLAGQAHVWFVRSPVAHARIGEIDVDEARASPGVLAVVTGRSLPPDAPHRLTAAAIQRNRDGSAPHLPARPLLPVDRVRHVGDTVAMVVAETREQARDAAELVAVDYEELPAVADARAALEPGAAQVWDEAPGNLALDWEGGSAARVEEAFARAHHVTRLELANNRVIIASTETRGVVARYDESTGTYELHTPSQGVNEVRAPVAADLGVPPGRVRVITPDVGGAFGMKIPAYPEHLLCAWAARWLGRPVKWIAERGDAFLTDTHGRDHFTVAELALDEQHRILAVRCDTVSNAGAYGSGSVLTIPTTGGSRCITGVYAIPAWSARARVVYTNTTPVFAYRGAGKPEYNYVVERLVDAAARELGLDAAELRRRNVVPPEAMPYDTGTGLVFDCGEFARNMDDALALADRDGFEARREEASARGRRRGFGFALFQEPDGFLDNRVSLLFDPTGELTVTLTGQSGGHGHRTTFAQVAAERLGVEPEGVRVLQGDTAVVGPGRGTGGSRTATVAGSGIARAADAIIEKARAIAAHLMEASVADVEFDAGVFRIAGTDRELALREVVGAAFDPARLPPDTDPGLEASVHYQAREYNYPCGCHVCEVEIDPETGALTLESYVAVNDHGVVINPMLLEGQVHGGVAQGVGQALHEHCVFDPDSAQLLSGSFMDYHLPRATDLPAFVFERRDVPSKTNPLGVKGVGESGCTAACPAVMNAVVDALAGLGVRNVDMPATPQRVWEILRQHGEEGA